MLKRNCVLLAGLLWQAAPSSAQPLPEAQKVPYSRDTPKSVALATPRKVKRLFWGTFAPKTGASPLGIQLYESSSGVTLELWQKSAKRFVRINRVSPLYEDGTFPSSKFGIDLYWTERAQKNVPVLVITQTTSGNDNLLPGDYQQIKVVAFRAGWKRSPSVQTFFDGNSNSGVDGFSAGYNGGGQLELHIFSGDHSGSTTNIYAWDGKQFSVLPEKEVRTRPFQENEPQQAPNP